MKKIFISFLMVTTLLSFTLTSISTAISNNLETHYYNETRKKSIGIFYHAPVSGCPLFPMTGHKWSHYRTYTNKRTVPCPYHNYNCGAYKLVTYEVYKCPCGEVKVIKTNESGIMHPAYRN
ncbi:hypothetical protein Y919_01135 [Caloranaerobacter azorensis H53214]|uniref:Uncharacterized protein n=1 Tax=Caloranaerobacter azorensis H53214 TaxID=1156417 RepID=A0A096DQ58_9FIRM|nr:hypothetical protein [Caloranaerobacter azorensis]KGG81381.1 hypothetical protein Y919_01135 [Caloranaerobacter azorensis H53214]